MTKELLHQIVVNLIESKLRVWQLDLSKLTEFGQVRELAERIARCAKLNKEHINPIGEYVALHIELPIVSHTLFANTIMDYIDKQLP